MHVCIYIRFLIIYMQSQKEKYISSVKLSDHQNDVVQPMFLGGQTDL